MVVEEVVEGERRVCLLCVVGIFEDVTVVFDVLGVVYECYVGVVHYQFATVEDVGDEADQFECLGVEGWIELLVDG